ncbi:bile acid:sodium symporter family protein [Alloalcanivorax mobilis]|uniref:bile acid:sodium symporter family protein n=1 Tax=Alloalcanivorax mobilis TaxID=2019569 RepID=UPI000C76B837|nr:bile acid:sodium symporter family protein [Alloalcanivorax mobilis]
MMISRLRPDNFTLMLLGAVLLASVLPVQGRAEVGFEWLTHAAIALLFFLHGAKLSREAIIAGALHWRLHLLVFAVTFAAFPLFGLALKPLLSPLVTDNLYLGVLYLCALPATVQSAIALTSVARGNIPAAICSASASTLLGIFITPVLVEGMLGATGGGGSVLDSIVAILLQLMLPFVLGQLCRPLIAQRLARHPKLLKVVDQGSILLVVYTAFSDSVNEGLWQHTPWTALAGLLVICAVLLTLSLTTTMQLSRRLGFSKEDEITVVFCGSKKSLASGVPMAKVLFPDATVGAILLPIMLFHQMQLIVGAVLAQRYASRQPPSAKGSSRNSGN